MIKIYLGWLGTIWEQISIFAIELKTTIMKVTAFIRKTAKKNDTDSMATIYFRLRDGKKDINPSLTPIIVESCYYYTFSVLAMDSVSYKFLFFWMVHISVLIYRI